MLNMWSCITVLLPVLSTFPTSATYLPPSSHSINKANIFPNGSIGNANILSNGSERYIQCLPKPNVTYPIYDSPLDLAITLGSQPFLSWQLVEFLRYVLIAINPKVTRHPEEYIPEGYYYYHKPHQLGSVSVIPAFTRAFTWADLYIVLHGLEEYAVAAEHAHEMCVEIIFRRGGLAGVIFLTWWTSEPPTSGRLPGFGDAGNHHRFDAQSGDNTEKSVVVYANLTAGVP